MIKDTVSLTIPVEKSVRQQLKVIAAQRAESMRDLLMPAIEKVIKDHAAHPSTPSH